MDRDFNAFPADEDGDALWLLATKGVDLSRRREIDFSVLMPSPQSAIDLAVELLRCEEKVSCTHDPDNVEFPMDVQVHPKLVPIHAAINQWQAELLEMATPFGGWGFEA
ncbi:ribonuclease E inhibitor RraB [Lysobacter sp. MMG2]|uniref:ribonuclease E inhibitor RraB n=1 Tax=Lysobacter sp. MMG2 TaxID=2801338 RepID=UPI001C215559|nr:ribonuclease E inhibitor RraB [Lysobacter sp. MMG2]